MAKSPRKRIALGQNFLRCPKLARRLVQESSIDQNDLVYEIGPGQGIFTQELARTARQVFAIEKDPALVRSLQKQFQHVHNVQILTGDFLQHHISARDYKLFASIPYNATAAIVRKLLYTTPVPTEACLILQKEAAEKFVGQPRETQFSILAKPRFDLQILRQLRRSDFDPMPGVDSVLLRITKRKSSLIHPADYARYQAFVRFGFGSWKESLKLTYKPIFTHRQWKQLSKQLAFPSDAKPSTLTVAQWVGLFDYFQHGVSRAKQARIKCK